MPSLDYNWQSLVADFCVHWIHHIIAEPDTIPCTEAVVMHVCGARGADDNTTLPMRVHKPVEKPLTSRMIVVVGKKGRGLRVRVSRLVC